MKVVLTGGLGYLGCELTQLIQMLPDLEELVVIDKAAYGVAPFSSLINRKVKLLVRDLRDVDAVRPAIQSADIIIHLAGLVGAPLVDRKPMEAWDANIVATRVIAENAASGAKIFFASTGSCYGKVDGICDEETPISPLSSYGLHKAEGEKILADKDCVNMRFATVYGLAHRTRSDLFINNMVQKALSDRSLVLYEGHAMRTFIHVKDAARAIVFLLQKTNLTYSTYNVGDERLAFSKSDICEMIAKRTPFTVIEEQFSKDVDQRDYRVSYSRLYAEGYSPQADFEDEINNLFTYYRAINDAKYENG